MSKNHNKKLYIIFIAVLILAIFFVIPYVKKEKSNPEISPITEAKTTESATILAGNIKTNLSFSKNISLYDVLTKAKSNNEINFSGKNYPGLGFFVNEIGTLQMKDGKNLLYYINGKEASVGVSSYILKNGDIIEWKLKWEKY